MQPTAATTRLPHLRVMPVSSSRPRIRAPPTSTPAHPHPHPHILTSFTGDLIHSSPLENGSSYGVFAFQLLKNGESHLFLPLYIPTFISSHSLPFDLSPATFLHHRALRLGLVFFSLPRSLSIFLFSPVLLLHIIVFLSFSDV